MFKTLATKPWLPDAGVVTEPGDRVQHTKTALLFGIAIITVIFFLFTITFLARSQTFDFQALAGEPWLPFSNLSPLWLNSLWLLLASVAFTLACRYVQRSPKVLLLSLLAVTVFTLLFVFGQLTVWQQLYLAGFYLNANPANSYYYLLTGVHGLHLLGGLLVLFALLWRYGHQNGHAGGTSKLVYQLKFCSWYWHYLFALWLFLFVLLTRDAETYNTIAAICGF